MKRLYLLLAVLLIWVAAPAQNFVTTKREDAAFAIASPLPSIYVDKNDDWLISKAASLLQTDIEAVTGKRPLIVNELHSVSKNIIILGTFKGSSIIQKLIAEKKIDINTIKGKWEAFQMQTVKNPIKGIENALVITGSDKRGTAYGVLELSRQI